MKYSLIGEKGGSSSTFKTLPDTLRSADSFELLLGLGSGRWKGLSNGLQSLEINNVPLENPDGSSNFKDFVVLFADGDPAQTQRVNFKLGGGGGTTSVNTAVVNGPSQPAGAGPWVTASVSTTGADFIDLRFIISALYYQDKTGIKENTMSLEIEMRPSGSSNWINPLISNAAPTYSAGGFYVDDGYGGAIKALMPAAFWRTSNTWNDDTPGYITFRDKTTSPSVKELRISVPNTGAYANKTWQVRARLLQKDLIQGADSYEERRTVQWESIAAVTQRILGTDAAWRGLAWLQVVGKASDQLSGVPSVRGIYDTKIVKVPTSGVYNPITRAYSGAIWDGSFEFAFTRDPAWCIKDLIEDPISGIAALAPGSTLDKWDALEASKYFSQQVSDGRGGTHPRFNLNVKIDQAQNAEELIQYLAGAVNAIAMDTGDGKWRMKVDKPETPAALYTRDNIEGEFTYSHTDVDSRYNDYTVSYLNAELNYAEDRARVFDQAHIDAFGRKPTTVVALGADNRQEALRRAMHRLRVSTKETTMVSFVTNRQGLLLQPLSVILVADTDLGYVGVPGNDGNRTTTRISAINGTTITLGSSIRLEAGVTYQIALSVPNPAYDPDANLQPTDPNWKQPTLSILRNVMNSAAQRGSVTTLYLDSALPAYTPVNAPIALSAYGLPSLPIQYRVMEISPQDEERVLIQALIVDTGKWDAADNVNEAAIIGQVTDTTVPPPTVPDGGMFSVDIYEANFQSKRVLTVNWNRPASLFLDGYIVQQSFNGGPWQTLAQNTQQNYIEIQQPQNGVYDFRIYAVDRRGRYSIPLIDGLTLTDRAEDYAPKNGAGPLSLRPVAGAREGERYTTTDQNPNRTYLWHNGQWVNESNWVATADQINYTLSGGGGTMESFKPSEPFATRGAPSGTYIAGMLAQDVITKLNSTSTAVLDTTPPATPTGVDISSSLLTYPDGTPYVKVTVAWNANVEGDLSGYDMQISENGGGYISFVTTTNSYSFIGRANTNYLAKVRAYDKLGNYSGFGLSPARTSTKDSTVPLPPVSLTVRSGFNSYYLSWVNSADADLDQVEIWENTANAVGGTRIAVVNASQNTNGAYAVTGLPTGTVRYYSLKSIDTSGNVSTAFSPVGIGTASSVLPSDLGSNLGFVERGSTFPSAGNFYGRLFFNQTDGKMYRWNSTTATGTTFWIKSIDGADIGDGTITYGRLAAGSVRTNELATNSVTATKAYLGDTSNAFPDPLMADDAFWTLNAATYGTSFVDRVAPNGRLIRLPVKSTDMVVNSAMYTIEKNAPFAVSVEVLLSAGTAPVDAGAGSGRLYVQIFNDAGAYLGVYTAIIYNSGVISLTIDNPVAGASKAIVQFYRVGGGTAVWDFFNPVHRRMNTASLIVNGAITALKLDVVDIIAKNVFAGKFTGGEFSTAASLPGTISITGQGVTIGTVAQQAGNSANNTWYDPSNNAYTFTGNKITKTGATGWAASAYTKEAYNGACVLSGRIGTGDAFMGLIDNQIYTNLSDYQYMKFGVFYQSSTSTTQLVVNNGVVKTLGSGYNQNSLWSIVYDGASIKWYEGSTLVHSVTNVPNVTYFAAVNIYTNGSNINSLNFQAGSDISLVNTPAPLVTAKINASSTTIDPGKILIAGATTLANWRNGTDQTKIEGGNIYANSIAANALKVGSRNLYFQGIIFSTASGAGPYGTGVCSWTSGGCLWINDQGVSTPTPIVAGSTTMRYVPDAQYAYIYWIKGTDHLTVGSFSDALGPDAVLVAIYQGNSILLQLYGGTIIDGFNIATGSIYADRIIAGTITADRIVLHGIDWGRLNYAELARVGSDTAYPNFTPAPGTFGGMSVPGFQIDMGIIKPSGVVQIEGTIGITRAFYEYYAGTNHYTVVDDGGLRIYFYDGNGNLHISQFFGASGAFKISFDLTGYVTNDTNLQIFARCDNGNYYREDLDVDGNTVTRSQKYTIDSIAASAKWTFI
jgi:predicted phage tail protein